MFFMSKQKQIESKIEDYRSQVAECIQAYHETLCAYCETGDRQDLRECLAQVHRAESKADDIRREVEDMMYTRALFPESRGDILRLLETMDAVPNQAERVVKDMVLENIEIPEPYRGRLLDLSAVGVRATEEMLAATRKLFSDFTAATALTGKIDELESQADQIEAGLIERIFASDMEGLQKILLRDVVRGIAGLCDACEKVGDHVRVLVAKRSI